MTQFITDLDQNLATWAASLGWTAEAFWRLFLAVIAGGLIGLEREIRGRQAGFRTNLLVSLGSALVMLVSIEVARRPWHANGFNINVDPARIAYSVMAGIGFLGAGIIIKQNGNIRGLTTAAAMWCVAAVGLAAGLGMYGITIFATLLIVAALWILDYFEDRLPKTRYRDVVIRRPWKAGCIGETVARLKSAGLDVQDLSFERSGEALSSVDITMMVAFGNKRQYYILEQTIEQNGDFILVAARPM